MTKLYINNVEYPVEDGIILNEKYNEELDSAIVTIPYTDKLDLSPFDFVKLEIDGIGDRYFLINTWTDTTVSFDPLKYSYNISLISETIKLQKIVCPNLAITQPIGLTPKTIAEKLQQYYEVYIHPQYPELTLSQELLTLCDTACPENMFSRPTMFEVFNTLITKLNIVVKITNHSIGYLKIDEYGHEIDTSMLYYDNETQNINEYANRLDVQATNVVTSSSNYYSISGLTVRGGNEPLLTDDNMRIVLDKPIYDKGDISSIWCYFTAEKTVDGETVQGKVKANISDYVVEKSEYDTYLVSNSASIIRQKGYKRNALYFVKGGNEILGLTYNDKGWAGGSTPIAIYNIMLDKTIDEGMTIPFGESDVKNNVVFSVEYKSNDGFRMNVTKNNKYNATLIDNQGETQLDGELFGEAEQDKINRLGNKEKIITATYYKESTTQKPRQVTDGTDEWEIANNQFSEWGVDQGTYYVRTYRLTIENNIAVSATENDTTYTITNNQFTAHGKTYTVIYWSDLPELSDYIDEYVLAQRDLVIYDDYILFKGHLYKDYVRKNLYYGINSKKRFTQIKDEFVTRNDIENYTITFDTSAPPNYAIPVDYNRYDALARYLLTPICFSNYPQLITDNNDYNEFPKYCFLRFYDKNNNLTNENYICVTPTTYSTGKSNIIQIAMADNYSAGMKLTGRSLGSDISNLADVIELLKNPSEYAVGGKEQKLVRYTDNYGEFKKIEYFIYTNKKKDFVEQIEGPTAFDTYIPIANNLPEVSTLDAGTISKTFVLTNDKVLYKDNGEVTALTISLNYKSTANVIIGKFANHTGVFYHYNIKQVYICHSDTQEYEEGDITGLGDIDYDMSIDYTDAVEWLNNGTNYKRIQLVTGLVYAPHWKSWGIVTPQGELLLGVNRGDEISIPTTIYMNIKKENY